MVQPPDGINTIGEIVNQVQPQPSNHQLKQQQQQFNNNDSNSFSNSQQPIASTSTSTNINGRSVGNPIPIANGINRIASNGGTGNTNGVQQSVAPPVNNQSTPSFQQPQPQLPTFTVLPPSHPTKNQTCQSPLQIKSILSLPPPLLLSLARANNVQEQKAIATLAKALPYLPSMALPPPSPTTVVIGDHPSIPILLGQVFVPPTTPGVLAPVDTTNSLPFEPLYVSAEDWGMKEARAEMVRRSNVSSRPGLVTTQSFDARETSHIAHQLTNWALKEQEQQVSLQVLSSKEKAVILASHAAARNRIVEAAKIAISPNNVAAANNNPTSSAQIQTAHKVLAGGEIAFRTLEDAVQRTNLIPYADLYLLQLDALASDYFTQLHREALNRLMAAAETSSAATLPTPNGISTSNVHKTVPDKWNHALLETAQVQGFLVQSAAAAALAAQVLAANELADAASQDLLAMGVDPSRLVPMRPKSGLKSLEVVPSDIAPKISPPKRLIPPPLPPTITINNNNLGNDGIPEDIIRVISEAKIHPELFNSEKRDLLLNYAHNLYTTDPKNITLLPLLHTIHAKHSDHLPTLLLMSCVYYTRGELESSLSYNSKLLEYDPNYVEAMSNIGTTLRALGKWEEAEQYWWKAISLRPTYWDATENLLGVLCNPITSAPPPNPSLRPAPTVPRYLDALKLCEIVEAEVYKANINSNLNNNILSTESISRPRVLPLSVPSREVHRLQNLFYAKGNLRLAIHGPGAAKDEYEKAVECALSLPFWAKTEESRLMYPLEGCSTRDLIIVVTIIGMLISETAAKGNALQVMAQLDLSEEMKAGNLKGLFRLVRDRGDEYVAKIMAIGGGTLPTVLLLPGALGQLSPMLFPEFGGILPSLLDPQVVKDGTSEIRQRVLYSTNQTTSTMLLTIAKTIQDSLALPEAALAFDGVPPSSSLLLPLYYLALALHPSPSTYNNLGILLSTLNASTTLFMPNNNPPEIKTGQQLALDYYQTGLSLDPKHPHLYTNLGSLLKDMGQLPSAVQMYRKAVKYNPNFDVALANLANAIKDAGQIQEAIPFYRRAVEINESFPEAICGLVNALSGVCDWVGRGGVNDDWIVDDSGLLLEPSPIGAKSGYIGNLSNLVEKQLIAGRSYGIGAIKKAGTLDEWIEVISQAIYAIPADQIGYIADIWKSRIGIFMSSNYDRSGFNEGGYIIRLVERLMRRVQRRWYIDLFGETIFAPPSSTPSPLIIVSEEDYTTYRRPLLPNSLSTPPVPTVLPFHTFTYPVTARETRLISHRTGLRISHATLNQPWLPRHVYPPPPPSSDGKLNIGYVSSDFGNHPLSHLMQSTFGFHNLERYNIFCYATCPSDKSSYRIKIETEAQHFIDASTFTTQQLVEKIVGDGIHILINMSGYTKGARNEIFAARCAPIQMSYMGFAGTLAAGWNDYFIVDPIVCPPRLVSGNEWRLKHGFLQDGNGISDSADGPADFEGDPDPENSSENFVYTEKLIYMPHSYFVTDHKQAWREDDQHGLLPGEIGITADGTPENAFAIEEDKRWRLRKRMFPLIRDDTFIFANWNQLYKIDPFVFRMWLRILEKHENSILWLLRFPSPGEAHLKETALRWAGKSVADRIIFTDVVQKYEHIQRGRIADLFLDTTECNAHTTAADILWSGTPLLTFPRHKHKLCSRVAASIALATGFGDEMIVSTAEEYEHRALTYSNGLSYAYIAPVDGAIETAVDGRVQRRGQGQLSELRKKIFLNRERMPLFDTKRWVRNMEQGLSQAWENWVTGKEFEDSAEWQEGDNHEDGNIWIRDEVDGIHSLPQVFTN